MAAKTPKARLDADKTAQPKTRILGRIPKGHCFGGYAPAFALEDTETGERTTLGAPVSAISVCEKLGQTPEGRTVPHGSYNTAMGCPECRGVPMDRTDSLGRRDPNGTHWTPKTAAWDAQPQPPLDPTEVGILVGSMKCCLSEIAVYRENVSPGQYQRLEVAYRQLIAIKDEILGKPV